MNYYIQRHGKKVSKTDYIIDMENNVFTCQLDSLVLNFSEVQSWTFRIGHFCTLITSNFCKVEAGDYCTIIGNNNCFFNVGTFCVLKFFKNCCVLSKGKSIAHCGFSTMKTYKLKRFTIYLVWWDANKQNCDAVLIGDKGDALLNIKHTSDYVSNSCARILKVGV